MSLYCDIAWSRQISRTSKGQVALWTVAALAMLTVHAGAAWWALHERPVPMADDAAPAIMVELASVAMAPSAEVEQLAADEADSVESAPAEAVDTTEPVEEVETVEPVEPVEATEAVEAPDAAEAVDVAEPEPVEAEPVEAAAVPMAVDPLMPVEPLEAAEVAALASEVIEPDDVVEPEPDAVIPIPEPRPEPPQQVVKKEEPRAEKPRRQERPRQQQQQAASRQQAKAQTRAQDAPRAAAPQASAGAGSSMSPARWQSRLMSHLERRKRYPSAAKRQRQQGVAQVRFTIDASGNVGSVSLTRSSGVSALDEEVVALVRRASPVPAPPPGVNRTIVVPIQFSLR